MRAAEAAKNTSSLMDDIVKIRNGEQLVGATDGAFKEIRGGSATVVKLIGEIAQASQEQSHGIDQINRAVVEMNGVTEHTKKGHSCLRTVASAEQKKIEGGEMNMAESRAVQDHAAKAMTGIEGKYLTFSLAQEEYGIGILKVKEIIGMMPVTTVPRAPGFIKGVINLRGKVIPVIDLRLKFAMEEIPYTERTCIIVVETRGKQGSILIGIVVDAVAEVMNIKGTDIEDAPHFGSQQDTGYILGMAKMNGGVKILLDIDKVLGDEAIAGFDRAA